jgi:hypothetical protein
MMDFHSFEGADRHCVTQRWGILSNRRGHIWRSSKSSYDAVISHPPYNESALSSRRSFDHSMPPFAETDARSLHTRATQSGRPISFARCSHGKGKRRRLIAGCPLSSSERQCAIECPGGRYVTVILRLSGMFSIHPCTLP